VSDGVWLTKGLYTFDDAKHTVSITELPVGVWTQDYKAFLDEMCTVADPKEKPVLKNFEDLYNHVDVRFDLELEADYYDDARANPQEFEKRFKLTNTWRTSNMVAFDMDSKIVKYKCVGDMLEAYYGPRLAAYELRRATEMARLRAEAVEADAKARFLRAVLEGSIDLRRATDEAIVATMKAHELPALSGPDAESVDSYEYLLRLRMDRVKASAVDDQEKAVAVARAAVAALEGTTAGAMWLKDLEEFVGAWEAMRAEREALLSGVAAPKKFKVKRKGAAAA
jgi:DNA topoisomerase-2